MDIRAGFLFNHYLSYQVLHGAPFAFELSRMHPEIQVDLLFSSPDSRAEAERIAALYPDHRCSFRLLSQGGLLRFLSTAIHSLHRPLTLLANRQLLASYSALIAPEKNYIIIKALPAFRNTRFIGLRHGAGDRPVSFNKGWLKFDYLLVPGQAYYDRFHNELPGGCCRIVGYPKFEVLEKMRPQQVQLFNNDRPTVLYAPHFHPQQSSWLKLGNGVLRFFANSDRYNLVFAPHARLFKHRAWHGNIDLDAFRGLAHIHIDTGSERLFDMSYTRAADIYLGDVSSQVYEFIYHERRPCVFLNANGLDPSRMNFWKFGPLIEDVTRLEDALISAREEFEGTFREAQDVYTNAAFSWTDKPPSQRGAEAIAEFLQDPLP